MAILLRALEPVSEAYLPLKVPVGKGALERNKIFELGDAAGSDNRHARFLQTAFGRRDLARHPCIRRNRHAQRAAERFEQCFGLVVGVLPAQVV